jgi:transposase
MSNSQQPKVPMHAVKVSADPGASQGARRATEDAPGSAPAAVAARQRFRGRAARTAPHVHQCRQTPHSAGCRPVHQPGEVGALMRREGVYSSSLSTWRRQREAPTWQPWRRKRGPKADPARVDALQIAQLTRERDKLRVELDKAQSRHRGPKKSYRAAGSPGIGRQQAREHLMAAVQELTPALAPGRRVGPWACGVVCLHVSRHVRIVGSWWGRRARAHPGLVRPWPWTPRSSRRCWVP